MQKLNGLISIYLANSHSDSVGGIAPCSTATCRVEAVASERAGRRPGLRHEIRAKKYNNNNMAKMFESDVT